MGDVWAPPSFGAGILRCDRCTSDSLKLPAAMPKRKAEVQLKREEEEVQPGDCVEDDNNDKSASEGDDESAGEGSDEGESDEDEDSSEGESDGSDSDDDSCPEASSSEAESEDDEEGEAYKEVNVQFEFFDPQERDFLGLKALLNTYLDGQQYDCSGLVDAIIRQTAVGTVVKSSEEDDPFAVLTAFNTCRGPAAGSPWLKQLREYLTARCPDSATRDKLCEAFSGPGTGLLVSERLINCPPQLAPPLMQMLTEEVDGAANDEDYPQEERREFTFKRYLHVTRVYTDPLEEQERHEEGQHAAGGSTGAPGSSRARPGRGHKGDEGKEDLIVYVRPEDEYLHQVCSWSFTFRGGPSRG
ncbi:hypothetical protein Vretimale_10805 [Volvox reticuliferus]|uniref:Protein BCCIP homolog n=2 Tax=Volvox reticuliferus TaxID=1737510 RepID=A0A8J4LQY7_9CHLO|nr:hypothetical protein Vretimale_10805 [Volvox reticuliferus]